MKEVNRGKVSHSLCLLHRFSHGEEHAVEQDGGHDEVVEQLIRRQPDADAPHGVPRREYKKRAGGGKPVDVVLTEALGHDAESLQTDRKAHKQN